MSTQVAAWSWQRPKRQQESMEMRSFGATMCGNGRPFAVCEGTKEKLPPPLGRVLPLGMFIALEALQDMIWTPRND